MMLTGENIIINNMQDFIAYSNLVIGSILMMGALVIQTKNWQSSFLFKVIPMFGGMILQLNGMSIILSLF